MNQANLFQEKSVDILEDKILQVLKEWHPDISRINKYAESNDITGANAIYCYFKRVQAHIKDIKEIQQRRLKCQAQKKCKENLMS